MQEEGRDGDALGTNVWSVACSVIRTRQTGRGSTQLTSSRACAVDIRCTMPVAVSMPMSRLFISWNLSGRHIAMADFIWPACLVSRT